MNSEPIETSIWIDAPPEVVFGYLVDAQALVRWMGDWAVVVPEPGGEYTVDINGVPIRGWFVDVDPPRRVVMSWGVAGSDVLPPGASTVEITLHDERAGTLLELVHRDLPAEQRSDHVIGWTHFLERLAIAATGADPGRDPWAEDVPLSPPPE